MAALLDDTSPVADSEREADTSDGNSQSFGAKAAVDGSAVTYWCSENGRKVSQWTARLTDRAVLTSVDLTWKNDRGKPYAPVKLEVCDAASSATACRAASLLLCSSTIDLLARSL